MSAYLLLNCRWKIDRAITHFNQLNSEVEAFISRQPYRVVREFDPSTQKSVFKLHMAEKIPTQWGLILGDCVHNTRSALDALAYALVKHGGGKPTRDTKFPIGMAKNNLAALKGASDQALTLVKRLKPHKGGNGPLNCLNDMDVIDKHRLIIVIRRANLTL